MPEFTLPTGDVAFVDECDAHFIGQRKWTLRKGRNGTKYVRSGRYFLLHREILDPPDGLVVDHIDGNGLNNSRSNLRICTTKQNLRNQKKRKHKTASKFKGVYRHRRYGLWGGQIRVDGKKYQREFASQTQLQAALWYDEMAVDRFGEFAKLNFPERLPLILAKRGGDLV